MILIDTLDKVLYNWGVLETLPNENLKAGIFIPTMNRVDFVIRQLRYYASVQCPHTIYIGDSSPKEESQKIDTEIKRLGNQIKAKYYHIPDCNDWQAHYYLITQVKEKYICYSGDDDYQIPNSVTQCIEFLENHPDYTSASGYAVSFKLKEEGSHGEIHHIADYPRQQIEDNTASERIVRFFENYYVTHFSVNRTAPMTEYWENKDNLQIHEFRGELLPTSLPVVHGKSKILDCLGFVRQIHRRQYTAPSEFDWITKPIWAPEYALFEKTLAKHIAQVDNIEMIKATAVIRHAFWGYLQKRLAIQYLQYYPPRQIQMNKIKKMLNSLRSKAAFHAPLFIKNWYRSTMRQKPLDKHQIHYQVTQPVFKYYKDFKPVMDSIAGKLS